MDSKNRKSFVACVLFVAFGVSWAAGAGCASREGAVVGESGATAALARPELTNSQKRAKELAQLTAQVYREATHFSYKAWIEHGKPVERLWCVVEQGRQHRCHLRVYTEEEGLFYELRCVPDPKGMKIREDNYRGGESEEYVVTPADYEKGKWDVRCVKGIYGCAFGTHLKSWLGPESYKPDFFEEIISGGEYIGMEEVDGHLCDVVETHRVKNLIEKIYLDQTSHAVRRWYNNYNGIVRDRVFSDIKIDCDVDNSAH